MKSDLLQLNIIENVPNGTYVPNEISKITASTAASVLAVSLSTFSQQHMDDFAHPPLKYRPTALYHLNDTISNERISKQLINFRDIDGYGSIAILPIKEYWEPEFLDKYEHLLKVLDSLGMWAIFCDDKSFPSGSAGGAIAKDYPELCARQLVTSENDVAGPCKYQTAIPPGTFMGCVAMNTHDHSKRINLNSYVKDGKLSWDVPKGTWKVMILVTNTTTTLIDYLNPASVDKWMSLTYQRFYNRFPEHFGTTIKSSFYDDIAIYQAKPSPDSWAGEEHTCWTDSMNTLFQKKYGIDPTLLYPALWYDIGYETSAARAMFFGLRAELLAENFVGRVADWCSDHALDASGHPAGDYELSPMAFSGDAIKFYKHAQRPLVDVIFSYGHGRNGYKLSSSAAYLYDRPLVQCETYGAFYQQEDESRFTPDLLYRTAMELFTRGINLIIPHGVWFSYPAKIIPHELSSRNPLIGPSLPDYNEWVARCQLILQGGRHVADIAVLYPIAAIMGDCFFGNEKTISDYQEISEKLTRKIRRDFTFMHPEILEEKCTIDAVNKTICLKNSVNYENYKILIIPGRSINGTIHVAVMQKAKKFFDAGGIVICTSKLPEKSAELGKDALVQKLVASIFGLDQKIPDQGYRINTNARGGKAYFIPNAEEKIGTADRLTAVLDDAGIVWDVRFENSKLTDGNNGEVSYIHKVLNNNDYYYFANSSDNEVDTWVSLKGKIVPEEMDPHSGKIRTIEYCNSGKNEDQVTRINLKIKANQSLFIRNMWDSLHQTIQLP